MGTYRLAFRVPTVEYRIVENLLAAYAKSAAEQIARAGGYKNFGKLKLTGPNAAKEIVRYAFNELIKEQAQKEAHKHPQMFIGESKPEADWGSVKVPGWLTNNKGPFVSIAMDIKQTDYDGMINSIKELYPEVYFNHEISNNYFIGALGIAYAHRIMAGQVKLKVTARSV